jgi:hypothetical protein
VLRKPGREIRILLEKGKYCNDLLRTLSKGVGNAKNLIDGGINECLVVISKRNKRMEIHG